MEPTRDPKSPCSHEPRWQRRPEDRPDEILAAALRVFADQGYTRTRIEDVAQRAGVSKGTLYCYFDSKEALFRAMVRKHIVSRLAAFQAKLDTSDASATELVRSFIAAMWQTLVDDRMVDVTRLIHRELAQFPELARFYSDEVILAARHSLDALIQRGVDRGEFRAVKYGFASRGIQMLIVHAAQLQSFFAAFDPEALTDEQVVEGVTDLLLNGLSARPATQTP
jgi:AcrR family transcriptional regulator